jgi:hypothetical protein
MENKFNIDNDERNRILSLHENSTKNQYLNIISEQTSKGLNYTVSYGQQFIGVGGNKFETPSGVVVTVDQTNKKLNIGKYLKFGCQPKMAGSKMPMFYTSYDGKNWYGNVGGALTNVLKKKYCKGTELKSNDEILGKTTQSNEQNKLKSIEAFKKFACVTSYPNAKQETLNDGTITYLINGEYYYSNGRKNTSKGVVNYTCNDPVFKQKGDKVKNVGNIVIPKDIDLSQITKSLPPELQSVITPPTIDGQPNTGGQPDFNQLLTQLQGIS